MAIDSFVPPTEEQILEDLRNAVSTHVEGTDPWISPNVLVPVLKAMAALIRAGYLRLATLHKEAFVTTCSGPYLDFHGIQAGGLARNPATYAQGMMLADAVVGTSITDGDLFNRLDGLQYQVVGTETATDTTLSFRVRATLAGEIGNLDSGASLTIQTPIVGLSNFRVDTTGVIGGSDSETDDSFRQRILFYKQNPPHGGSAPEYHEWCLTKVGVTRSFVQPHTPGPGSVTIYFMMDNIGDGVPSDDHVNDLANILTPPLVPADAEVIVAKPILDPIDVEITGLIPGTLAMRDKVEQNIKQMFFEKAQCASAAEDFVFAKQWIDEAVTRTPGLVRSKVTDPPDDVTITGAGHLPTIGVVSFA